MVRSTSRKALRTTKPKPAKETEEGRTDTPVGFRLNPAELRRVQEHLARAARAAGVEVTLAGYAKAATLAYGDHRTLLAEIDRSLRTPEAQPADVLHRLRDLLQITEVA